MNELMISGSTSSKMSSREIAELMEKRHADVLRDIKNLIEQGAINERNFALVEYKDAKGEMRPAYLLDFDATMTLITGYDAVRRAKVIKRWRELETGVASSAKPYLPEDYASALRALANSVEEKALAIKQRDEAIKTKAQIGSKREASAMATASVAVRKAAQLQDELGRGETFRATTGISWISDFFPPSKGLWSVLGKKLTAISEELDLPIIRVPHPKYDSVKGYHIDAIETLRCRLVGDINMLGKYRHEF